ncbi:DUF4232 domain-containing protein [Nocardia terpenica]|nr:DUF4232 domain-containing protein [Nocardia terpenica]MBF6103285.1 DUF4232 domain-containing protein [Nocardia terpenica]MBF6110526.1 DUF4232 domain-containing protein [Nocardia terpenica]MBF6116657.1 DUF4232 domain-containing protein [Nocardia terpenica]
MTACGVAAAVVGCAAPREGGPVVAPSVAGPRPSGAPAPPGGSRAVPSGASVPVLSGPTADAPPDTAAAARSGVTSGGSGSTAGAAQPNPDWCGPRQVDVSGEVMSAAATHRGVRLTFTLAAGAPPCALSGYPGVDTGDGGPLLHAERQLRGYMGGLPPGNDDPPTVVLQPGTVAHAIVEGSAVDAAGHGCPTYTDLLVTPPNSTDTRTVTVPISSCALAVHPVTE